MIKNYLEKIYNDAANLSRQNIENSLAEAKQGGILLDVGCWKGEITQRWIKATSASETHGIELIKEAALKARKKGIKAKTTNINRKWPYKNNTFDYVVSNLVIEHLSDVDHFISESYRVLKKGGITVVSTNNLASWHNIFCLFLGWAPFDMTNSSHKLWSIGNPMALHANEVHSYDSKTWTHKCIYTTKWLKDWYELYGFKFSKARGAGYFPLPPQVGLIEKKHAALITLSFRK